MDGPVVLSMPPLTSSQKSAQSGPQTQHHPKPNQVGTVALYGIHIVSLVIEGQERLCLAQISNTLLKQFSYNEIHNRRVALGITCVQCTPVQLEILRRAGAMPPSSRRCGMITRREAERLCKSFLSDNSPPRLPDDFAFSVHHECGFGCRGAFLPSRYNSSRAKCIKCTYCGLFFSPNKFIFHSHPTGPADKYVQPDAANFNSWRRHMKLSGNPPDDVVHAWEDVKAMFNGGTRKRMLSKPGSGGGNDSTDHVVHAWDDVKAIFNGGPTRKRLLVNGGHPRESPVSGLGASKRSRSSPTAGHLSQTSVPTPSSLPPPPPPPPPPPSSQSLASSGVPSSTSLSLQHQHHQSTQLHSRVPPFPELPLPISRSLVMDYVWHQHQQAAAVAAAKSPGFAFPHYAIPWLAKRAGPVLFPGPLPPPPLSGSVTSEPTLISASVGTTNVAAAANTSLHQSAFRPVIRSLPIIESPSSLNVLSTGDAETSPRTNTIVTPEVDSDDEVDIETMEDDEPPIVGCCTVNGANSILQNLGCNAATTSSSGTSSNHSGQSASPQCWSPARETEREAEKIAEEAAAALQRDVKPEVSKSLESWHGSAFYQHLNILKGGGESSDRATPDCSACRPRGIFYGQVHSPPASTN